MNPWGATKRELPGTSLDLLDQENTLINQ